MEKRVCQRPGLLFILLFVVAGSKAQAYGVDESSLAIVVNVNDPLSLQVSKYYSLSRSIPEENIIHVSIDPNKDILSVNEFKALRNEILRQTDARIQGYAVAWHRPYRVNCMSITSALTMGYHDEYCSAGCGPTKKSTYYNSNSLRPENDHNIRPSMMLAALTFEQAKQLIDRGVRSDYSRPLGDVYLLNTSDRERNVRANGYISIANRFSGLLNINIVDSNWLRDREDILFYFTGVKRVKHLGTLEFLPGAAADHLTSLGGVTTGGTQMSSIEWLQAGVTASYGTVVEPCNHPGKFSNPIVLMQHYLNGNTLLEAYWKSVLMPGQGLFIGDPLARPFGGCRLVLLQNGEQVTLVNRLESYLPMRENVSCRTIVPTTVRLH